MQRWDYFWGNFSLYLFGFGLHISARKLGRRNMKGLKIRRRRYRFGNTLISAFLEQLSSIYKTIKRSKFHDEIIYSES
jgi:hypothetical protein